jgi:hypothetical protein
MSLYNTYNNEDIIIRAVIAGMLDVLNNGIKYNQVWSNEEIEEVDVPWFYNQSGDERFMQDFYTHYHACNFPKPVDGNFDRIPRGVITYSGSTIDANRITNRFVQGRYLKEVDGQLQSYVSFLYSIPLTINFECEMLIDTQVTSLKVEQAIRETFYKTKTFYVYYKGLRLGCTAGFSEDDTIDKLIEYSFNEENQITLKFNIEIETYQPVFDPTTEMDANNYMRGIGYRIYGDSDTDVEERNDGEINIISPTTNSAVPKGYPLLIEWDYVRELFILGKVDAYYVNSGENEWNLIEKGIDNREYWFWNIPETFTNFKAPKIIFEEDSSTQVYRQPTISVLPDINTKAITADSFTIINNGYFMTTQNQVDSSIGIILEMKTDAGATQYTNDGDIYLNINHFQIDKENPVWIAPDASIIFPGTVDYKVIDIHIANSVNNDIFGVVRDITII